jgi:pentatricopeptide repeat protein
MQEDRATRNGQVYCQLISLAARQGDTQAAQMYYDHMLARWAGWGGWRSAGGAGQRWQALVRWAGPLLAGTDRVWWAAGSLAPPSHLHPLPPPRRGIRRCKNAYNALLLAYARAGDAEGAHALFQEMQVGVVLCCGVAWSVGAVCWCGLLVRRGAVRCVVWSGVARQHARMQTPPLAGPSARALTLRGPPCRALPLPCRLAARSRTSTPTMRC